MITQALVNVILMELGAPVAYGSHLPAPSTHCFPFEGV